MLRQVLGPLLVALTIAAIVLHTPQQLEAMPFQKFDGMHPALQAEYVADMIQATEAVLRKQGRADLADQIQKLFATTEPGDLDPIGIVELERNIARARVADLNRVSKDANAPRLDVEDALFVTLKKNNIFTDAMTQAVMDAMQGWHPVTAMEFVAMPVAERRLLIARLVQVAVPDYFFRDHVADVVAKKEPATTETVRADLALAHQQFGSAIDASQDAAGFDALTRTLEQQNAQKPASLVISAVLHQIYNASIADLKRKDAVLVKKNDDIYDHRSIILSDGRHVLPRKDGAFMVITRNIDGPDVELEKQYWPEAQHIYDCMKAGGENCIAAATPANSPAAISPTPAPTQNKPEAPVDDPIGQGGFITPPQN
jgi:hypothetical protein